MTWEEAKEKNIMELKHIYKAELVASVSVGKMIDIRIRKASVRQSGIIISGKIQECEPIIKVDVPGYEYKVFWKIMVNDKIHIVNRLPI